MFHLPDLPTVGYATERERAGTDAIMLFMRECERDRLRLLTIVLEGRERWRHVARVAFGYQLGIDDEALDTIYDYFTLQAARPADQRRLLEVAKNRDKWREIVREILPDIEAQREAVKALPRR